VRDGMTKAEAIAQIVAAPNPLKYPLAYLSRGSPMHSRAM
jgi:hypothetical protein